MCAESKMPKPITNYKSQRTRAVAAGAEACPECEYGWLQYMIQIDKYSCPKCGFERMPEQDSSAHELFKYPKVWIKGQLLNVRHVGDHRYNITVLGEEVDPDHLDRYLQFTDSFECQAFVSWWYAREATDPRCA